MKGKIKNKKAPFHLGKGVSQPPKASSPRRSNRRPALPALHLVRASAQVEAESRAAQNKTHKSAPPPIPKKDLIGKKKHREAATAAAWALIGEKPSKDKNIKKNKFSY